MIKVTKNLFRETSEVDPRTSRPIVLQLVEGGKLVKLKLKGERTWYTVTVKQLWMLGAQNRASESAGQPASHKVSKNRSCTLSARSMRLRQPGRRSSATAPRKQRSRGRYCPCLRLLSASTCAA